MFHVKEVSSPKRYSFYMIGISRLDTNLTWAVGASKRLVCCWLNLQWLFTQLMAHELKKKRMQSLGRRRRKNSVGVQEKFWKDEKRIFFFKLSFNFLWNRQRYTTAFYFGSSLDFIRYQFELEKQLSCQKCKKNSLHSGLKQSPWWFIFITSCSVA